MNRFARFLPALVVLLALAYVVSHAVSRKEASRFHFQELAGIPVRENGRVKPLDTVARNTLMVISKRRYFNDEEKKEQPAIRWLMDAMTGKAGGHEVFRIEDDQLLRLLNLKPKPLFYRYSPDEIAPKFDALAQQAKQALALPDDQRDMFNQNVLRLSRQLDLYMSLQDLAAPSLLMVAPASENEEWRGLTEMSAHIKSGDNPAALAISRLLMAYAGEKADAFNQELVSYEQWLGEHLADSASKAQFEVFFNRAEPFYCCSLLYVIMFLLVCVSWVCYSGPLNRAAFWLGVVALAVHSTAILARMYLLNRPPIINLYSTAIFIGWGCLLLGLIIEEIFRNGLGNVVGAVAGAATTLIAHNLSTDGDTMEMMRAVLDTNFWLATHVVIINFGYAATFVAGIVGAAFILMGVFTRALQPQRLRVLGQVIYGTICFATLLSFTGTVLGGIWADQSWGRFWGWDPKENGALLIVLWNALILHARWGGMVKQRGMAVLAVFGNMVTAWSWFGVNMLGVGLHSYGFMEGAAFWLIAFEVSQLVLIAIGCLPSAYWRSFKAKALLGYVY
jgi:ABC-type transport system involved in cytochrome c biogenesis permease subunit